MENAVYTSVVSGALVYMGGEFSYAGALPAAHIAAWDGRSWHALGSGTNRAVTTLAVCGDTLYTGGFFQTAGGAPAANIAAWDGASWRALGSGLNDWAATLAAAAARSTSVGNSAKPGGVCAGGQRGTLYAGGEFSRSAVCRQRTSPRRTAAVGTHWAAASWMAGACTPWQSAAARSTPTVSSTALGSCPSPTSRPETAVGTRSTLVWTETCIRC